MAFWKMRSYRTCSSLDSVRCSKRTILVGSGTSGLPSASFIDFSRRSTAPQLSKAVASRTDALEDGLNDLDRGGITVGEGDAANGQSAQTAIGARHEASVEREDAPLARSDWRETAQTHRLHANEVQQRVEVLETTACVSSGHCREVRTSQWACQSDTSAVGRAERKQPWR